MLFFLAVVVAPQLKKKKKTPQADERVLSRLSIRLCVPWVRQKVLWHSTHYHDDSAAYHAEEDAATEKNIIDECIQTI